MHGFPARGDSPKPWGHKPKSAFFGMATYQNAVAPQAPGDGYALGVIFGASGGYSLSLADYAKFRQLHLAGLAGRDGLLKASSIRHLHAGPGEYAMGWGLVRRRTFAAPVRSYASVIKTLTDPVNFENFRFMPVTRDMSNGQRTLLYNFLNSPSGADTSAVSAIAATDVLDGSAEKALPEITIHQLSRAMRSGPTSD